MKKEWHKPKLYDLDSNDTDSNPVKQPPNDGGGGGDYHTS